MFSVARITEVVLNDLHESSYEAGHTLKGVGGDHHGLEAVIAFSACSISSSK